MNAWQRFVDSVDAEHMAAHQFLDKDNNMRSGKAICQDGCYFFDEGYRQAPVREGEGGSIVLDTAQYVS